MPVLPSRHIRADRLEDNLNRRKLQNGAGAPIAVHEIVAIDTLSEAEAHLNAKKAIADGTHLQTGLLYIAKQKAVDAAATDRGNRGDKFWAVRTAVVPLDTSSASRGDPVYLSDSVAGGITLTAPTNTLLRRQVGQVLVVGTVAAGGHVLVDLDNYGTGGAASAAGDVIDVYTRRVQLTDLVPGNQTFGTFGPVPVDRPIIGAAVLYQDNIVLGTSGITDLGLDISVGGYPLMFSLQVVAGSTPITGAQKYLTPFTDPSDFGTFPHILRNVDGSSGSINGIWTITGNAGSNLDQLDAFDVTFIILVAKQTL